MAFLTKTDPFGIADDTILTCVATNDNTSASVTEAHDDTGSFIAKEVYGEKMSPSADYKVIKSGSVSSVKLGEVTTYKTKRIVLTNVQVNTSAGGETTVSASGEQIEDSSDGTCPTKYSLPAISVGVCHHAKILFSAFTLSGTGCYLQSANYAFACSNGTATKDGETIAHGVYEGYAEAQIEILQTGSTSPTLAAGTGWFISAPLSCTNPDADYPTWSATVRKHLEADSQSS